MAEITTTQLSQLANISERMARKATLLALEESKAWRGCVLQVREAPGLKRGGNSGKSYLIQVDSLPMELRQKYLNAGEPSLESVKTDAKESSKPVAKTTDLVKITNEISSVKVENTKGWLTVEQIAQEANCTSHAIRDALRKGIPWRGASLHFIKNGKKYLINPDSLPNELKKKIPNIDDTNDANRIIKKNDDVSNSDAKSINNNDANRITLTKPTKKKPSISVDNKTITKGELTSHLEQSYKTLVVGSPNWWEQQLQPYIKVEPNKLQLTTIAEQSGCCVTTVRNKLKQIRSQGFIGQRKPRDDAKKKRTLITRKWQSYFGNTFTISEQESINHQLITYIRSLWANGRRTARQVSEDATLQLIELTKAYFSEKKLGEGQAAAWPNLDYHTICRIPRNLAELRTPDEQHKDCQVYRMVYDVDTDRLTTRGKYEPRVKRGLTINGGQELKPSDIVIGDVHYSDTLFQNTNSKEKASTFFYITWYDVATGRIHLTIKERVNGLGVNRADIVHSYCAMVEQWGVPTSIYIDNGKEYGLNEFRYGIQQLSTLIQTTLRFENQLSPIIQDQLQTEKPLPAIIQAKPYNPQSKGYLEGLFNLLENYYFSNMRDWQDKSGYRGGNPLAPKNLHEIGKPPIPFQGTREELFAQIANQTELYHHTKKVSGPLKGFSPYERLQYFLNKGWPGINKIDTNFLQFAFSQQVQRKVKKGGCILLNNTEYRNDDLLSLVGVDVKVLSPITQPNRVLVYQPITNKWITCGLNPKYDFYDSTQEGAKEQQRQTQLFYTQIVARRQNCVLLNTQKLTAELLANKTQYPELPVNQTIEGIDSAAWQQFMNQHETDELEIQLAHQNEQQQEPYKDLFNPESDEFAGF